MPHVRRACACVGRDGEAVRHLSLLPVSAHRAASDADGAPARELRGGGADDRVTWHAAQVQRRKPPASTTRKSGRQFPAQPPERDAGPIPAALSGAPMASRADCDAPRDRWNMQRLLTITASRRAPGLSARYPRSVLGWLASRQRRGGSCEVNVADHRPMAQATGTAIWRACSLAVGHERGVFRIRDRMLRTIGSHVVVRELEKAQPRAQRNNAVPGAIPQATAERRSLSAARNSLSCHA